MTAVVMRAAAWARGEYGRTFIIFFHYYLRWVHYPPLRTTDRLVSSHYYSTEWIMRHLLAINVACIIPREYPISFICCAWTISRSCEWTSRKEWIVVAVILRVLFNRSWKGTRWTQSVFITPGIDSSMRAYSACWLRRVHFPSREACFNRLLFAHFLVWK